MTSNNKKYGYSVCKTKRSLKNTTIWSGHHKYKWPLLLVDITRRDQLAITRDTPDLNINEQSVINF